MNYEQKYKEASKVIESLYNVVKYQSSSDALLASQTIEKAFPELCESEDEQHRKWILEYLYNGLRKSDEQFKDQYKSAIAWLEKQGEKFLSTEETELNSLAFLTELGYTCIPPTDTETKDTWEYVREFCEKFGRLPKDEDELAVCIDYVMKKKSSWSEEDELVIHNIVLWLDGQYISETARKQCLEWFNKHYMEFLTQPQPKQEWSEESEKNRQKTTPQTEYDFRMWMSTMEIVESSCAFVHNEENQKRIEGVIIWLKSLKPRWKPTEEQLKALELQVVGRRDALYELFLDLRKL